jgi:hypothetical protein
MTRWQKFDLFAVLACTLGLVVVIAVGVMAYWRHREAVARPLPSSEFRDGGR